MNEFSPCLFSIVIPTYNRRNDLLNCLECLTPYFTFRSHDWLPFDLEVIVTDDGHDSVLSDLLLSSYPWCNYQKGPRRGPAANRNHGARVASGAWILFTDDDCLPQSGWVEAFASAVDDCHVLEGKTMAVGIRSRVDMESPINENGGHLWSCNFAIRRDIFINLGGFNENFPAPAMEDMEFYLRIKKVPLISKFIPNAVVLHPWRKKRGLKFVKEHARSVATFVRLHPEQASRYSFASQLINSLRSIKNLLSDLTSSRQFSGSFRRLVLELSSCYYIWLYVRELRSCSKI